MLSVVKVRIYPNKVQEELIHKTFGSCRLVYNLLLDAKIKAYECGDRLSIYDLKKRLVPMKNSVDGAFLKEVDSTALQNAILNMDRAYQSFFKLKGGYPKFKSKHHSRQSYQSSTAGVKRGKLFLPKIGLVKTKFHRGIPKGLIKTVIISYQAGCYFASINYESSKDEVLGKNNGQSIGIDMGVKIFASLSNGTTIKVGKEHCLKKLIRKITKAQKSLSQKKKGSCNRIKAKAKLAKIHMQIQNKRNDFLHKVSHSLSENQTIVVENLQIKNMSKRAKGTIEEPNQRASAKRGLNRSILQQSWGKFFELLAYKLKRNGGELIKVNPQNTSLQCSNCGHVHKDNRQTQAGFNCINCGFTVNADFNASINILAAGTAVKAS